MDSAPHLVAPASAPTVRWQWSRLDGLTAADIYAVLAARQQVFTVEQRCAFQDADGHDFHAWHLLAWDARREPPADSRAGASLADPLVGPSSVLAGYLRVLDAGRKFEEPSIGRVLTVPPYRGIGFGRTLMAEGLVRTRLVWPGRPIRIAAQHRLERFYAELGFRAASAPYDEDGIAHLDMLVGASA